jgi:hypothetical protein
VLAGIVRERRFIRGQPSLYGLLLSSRKASGHRIVAKMVFRFFIDLIVLGCFGLLAPKAFEVISGHSPVPSENFGRRGRKVWETFPEIRSQVSEIRGLTTDYPDIRDSEAHAALLAKGFGVRVLASPPRQDNLLSAKAKILNRRKLRKQRFPI